MHTAHPFHSANPQPSTKDFDRRLPEISATSPRTMARPKRIADTSIRTVLPPGRYSDGPGGNGLSLLVKETKTPGLLSKTWSVRIRINGKYTNRGLGSYPKVTLAEARRKALAYQQAVQENRDPAAAGPPIFRKVVADCIEYRSPTWREGSRSRQDWENSFENHVFPHIGNKPINNITHQDLFEVFASIWVSKHPTAQDLVNRISAVMKWAIGNDFIDSDPTPKTVSYLPKINTVRNTTKPFPTTRSATLSEPLKPPAPTRELSTP